MDTFPKADLKEERAQFMRKLIVLAVIVAIVWYGYYYFKQHRQELAQGSSDNYSDNSGSKVSSGNIQFICDGRVYCSQMTSCEEATFFLKNCPDVKMDGNNDGIPCEKQWCN